mgnify:CR=1 FL=1
MINDVPAWWIQSYFNQKYDHPLVLLHDITELNVQLVHLYLTFLRLSHSFATTAVLWQMLVRQDAFIYASNFRFWFLEATGIWSTWKSHVFYLSLFVDVIDVKLSVWMFICKKVFHCVIYWAMQCFTDGISRRGFFMRSSILLFLSCFDIPLPDTSSSFIFLLKLLQTVWNGIWWMYQWFWPNEKEGLIAHKAQTCNKKSENQHGYWGVPYSYV